MIGHTFGWERVRAFTRSIGGKLYRGPEITARSAAGWWQHFYSLMQAEDPALGPLLTSLQNVGYRGRITAGLPAGVPHLHKFGSHYPYLHARRWCGPSGNHCPRRAAAMRQSSS